MTSLPQKVFVRWKQFLKNMWITEQRINRNGIFMVILTASCADLQLPFKGPPHSCPPAIWKYPRSLLGRGRGGAGARRSEKPPWKPQRGGARERLRVFRCLRHVFYSLRPDLWERVNRGWISGSSAEGLKRGGSSPGRRRGRQDTHAPREGRRLRLTLRSGGAGSAAQGFKRPLSFLLANPNDTTPCLLKVPKICKFKTCFCM